MLADFLFRHIVVNTERSGVNMLPYLTQSHRINLRQLWQVRPVDLISLGHFWKIAFRRLSVYVFTLFNWLLI